MPLLSVNRDPSPRDLRIFAGGLCLLAGGLAAWLHFGSGHSAWAIALGGLAVLALAGLASLPLARALYRGWSLVFSPVGLVVSFVALGVVYYGVLMPVGLLRRLFGRDTMDRSPDREAASYWQKRAPTPEASRYFRQF